MKYDNTKIPFSTGITGLEGDFCGIGMQALRNQFGPCLVQHFDLTKGDSLTGGKNYAAIKLPEGAVCKNMVLHIIKEKAGATLNVGRAYAGSLNGTMYASNESLATKKRRLFDLEAPGTGGSSTKWLADGNSYITIGPGANTLDGVVFDLYVSIDYVCAPTDVNEQSPAEQNRVYPDPDEE